MDLGKKSIFITATVQSGAGKGKLFVKSLSGDDPLIQMLKRDPFPGTLNLKLRSPLELNGLNYGKTARGVIRILEGQLENTKVAIKWSQEFPMQLQIISEFNLRESLKLSDGQKVHLNILLKNVKRAGIRTLTLAILQMLRK